MEKQPSNSRELQCVGRLEIARPKPVGFLCGTIPVPTDKAFHDFNASELLPSAERYAFPYVLVANCIYLVFFFGWNLSFKLCDLPFQFILWYLIWHQLFTYIRDSVSENQVIVEKLVGLVINEVVENYEVLSSNPNREERASEGLLHFWWSHTDPGNH